MRWRSHDDVKRFAICSKGLFDPSFNNFETMEASVGLGRLAKEEMERKRGGRFGNLQSLLETLGLTKEALRRRQRNSGGQVEGMMNCEKEICDSDLGSSVEVMDVFERRVGIEG